MNTKQKFKARYGFTLVELIVVISILAILGTIAFMSFNSYFWKTRDSVRVTDLKSIQEWLTIHMVKAWTYPLPDDNIEITAWTELYSYQWYAWDSVINLIRLSGKAKDPKDGSSYIYATDKNKKKIQLMWYLESWDSIKFISQLPNLISETFASDINYASRYTYVTGNMIWIITDENKAPINENEAFSGWVNILDQDNPEFITYFGWDVYEWWKSTATWQTLETQIFAAITNTLPCSATTYNEYVISPMADKEEKSFTKNNPIEFWDATTKVLTIQCLNWALDTTNAKEVLNISCNDLYLPDWNGACIKDDCLWTFDENTSVSTATSQSISSTWHHATTWGVCTFDCKPNYSWDDTNKVCKADTKVENCISLAGDATWNTASSITQTWNWIDWLPTLVWAYNETVSTTACNFKCNTWYTWDDTNKICKANDCTMPATDTYSTLTYNIPTPLALLHWNTEPKIWTRAFWTSPTNWTMTANFSYTCTAWVLTEWATTAWAWTCWTWYSFNGNWTTPACSVTNCIFDNAWSLFWDWITNYCYFGL